MKMHKPNFEKSNVNISATLAEFLHAPNQNSVLPELAEKLKKGYSKVVFICFDGLGIYPLTQTLSPTDFLRSHVADTLLAPFPSTTTNATTSLITNKLPREHGWFGWSMNFPSIGRNVNIFTNQDSWTGEKLKVKKSPLGVFPYYFDEAKTNYKICTVFPPFVKAGKAKNHVFYSLGHFFEVMERVCAKRGKRFVYAYCPEPDHSMHEFGVNCEETRAQIRYISNKVQALANKAKDALFVITADHGMTDVTGYVEMYKDEKLYDMLNVYPFMEPRAVAFSVKDGMSEQFEEYFRAKYGKDFEIHKSSDLVTEGYFGNRGDKEFLLGDYIAVSTNGKLAMMVPNAPAFKGHHTGLSEEMEVPLIVIEK